MGVHVWRNGAAWPATVVPARLDASVFRSGSLGLRSGQRDRVGTESVSHGDEPLLPMFGLAEVWRLLREHVRILVENRLTAVAHELHDHLAGRLVGQVVAVVQRAEYVAQ